jgi:hypothetical protein
MLLDRFRTVAKPSGPSRLCDRFPGFTRHLTVDGLIQIAEITETMNRKKPRQDLIRILRDYTPEALDTGS